MFGGIGVLSDGVLFALVYDGILYLKTTLAIAKAYAERFNTVSTPLPAKYDDAVLESPREDLERSTSIH